MQFIQEKLPLSKINSQIVFLGVFQDESIAKLLAKVDKGTKATLQKNISAICKAEGFTGKLKETIVIHGMPELKCVKLVLFGLGKHADNTTIVTRKFSASASRIRHNKQTYTTACLFLRAENDMSLHVQAAAEGWVLGSYSFLKYKTRNKSTPPRFKFISIVCSNLLKEDFKDAIKIGETIATATNFARDLIAEPACSLTPTKLAQEASKAAKATTGLTIKVFDRAAIKKMNMNSFLGVARGADEPPKFIVLRYKHPKSKKTVALVGKGITFDSGGLSLKNAQGMETMKYDMAGAAAVIATMQAIAKLKVKVNVLGIVAATENMPSGHALHPGDVITAMNGKTIEVNNTDAEGRLILADALCYAVKQKPNEIIDIATLTGAMTITLGKVAGGIMSNNQKLIDKLIASALAAGERLWQLPLYDEYKDYLKSDIADLKNAGSRGEAGTAAGAIFLQEFVEDVPWAHLDIAGVGWQEKDKDELNKGGTGFGVRTFCHYLLSH